MWLWWTKEALDIERKQLIEEGRDIRMLEAEFERLEREGAPSGAEFQKAVNELLDKGQTLPISPGYRYVEPSDLKGIQEERGKKFCKVKIPRTKEGRYNRIHRAWLGRCAGCLLGKPFEGTLRPRMVKFLNNLGLKEISNYPWLLPGSTDEIAEGLNSWFGNTLPAYRGTTIFPGDDDTNYTVMCAAMVKQYGIGFTSDNMADFLMNNVPLLRTCTAERVAYRNLANQIVPPESASVRNPYREYIGAQIRADFFGYVAMGNPRLAAELAWRDARISHVKNGIYGAMWVAAMIAAAPGVTNARKLIKIGLNEVPKRSRFFERLTEVLDRYDEGATYFEMLEFIHKCWDEKFSYSWTHVIANAQIVAVALLYSEGDFEKAITRAVGMCLDTDCNGATVGSIMGMMLGDKPLPEKWTSLMNDTIHTDVAGYDLVKISDLAKEMFEIHAKHFMKGKKDI
jgi:ADP-ribosylglycohydrolase